MRTVEKSEEQWKKELSPEQYRVLREKGTEWAFSGQYWNHHENGSYSCAGCGASLFDSEQKFDSRCGWPSFYDALDKDKIEYVRDTTHGMIRTEVVCKACGGHLGHIFDDAPQTPTGQRYCINSVSIEFKPREEPDES
ncbi:MAG TPA: peptide-methionine (R)-S-oxide reductase MsrB [Fimbriimonas sp.]|nr:peptide-methionine (R)-S-oxide reductase MsrB [Fimbriimonas sp.]